MKTKLWRHTQRRWVSGISFRARWSLCGDQINSEPLSCSLLHLQHSHQHHLDRPVQIRNPLHELVFFQPLHDDGQDYWPEGGEGGEERGANGEFSVAKWLFEESSMTFTYSFLVRPWWFGRRPPEKCPLSPLSATETNTHRVISPKRTGEMPVFWCEPSPGSRPWSCRACCRSRLSLQCRSVFPCKGEKENLQRQNEWLSWWKQQKSYVTIFSLQKPS